MRKPKAPKFQYDTLTAAAAGLDIPVDLLKAAKSAGCPSFKHGRVDGATVREWIEKNGDKIAQSPSSWRDKKLAVEVERLRFKLDVERGLYAKKSDMASAVRRALAQVATISETKLVNEFPMAVAGLDVPQARVYGRRLHDALMEECQKLSKEFPE